MCPNADSDQSVLCKDGRRCATQEVVEIRAEITACSGVIVIDAETAAAWPTEGLGQEESWEENVHVVEGVAKHGLQMLRC